MGLLECFKDNDSAEIADSQPLMNLDLCAEAGTAVMVFGRAGPTLIMQRCFLMMEQCQKREEFGENLQREKQVTKAHA